MTNLQAFTIVFYKSIADLKTESSRYFLSFLWWLIDPLIYFGIFFFLFSSGFRGGSQGVEFANFLIVGLGTFRWIQGTVNSAASSIVANKITNQKIYLPKWFFPVNVFLVNSVKFFVIFLLVIVITILCGNSISLPYVSLPVIILIQAMFILGISFPLAAVIPFIPDLKFIVSNITMALFFLSGVFFDVSRFPDYVQRYFYFNPAAGVVKAYRDVLIDGKWPNVLHLGWAFIFSALLMFIGLYLLNRFDKVYSKVSN